MRNYLGLLTGMIIGGIQHYYMLRAVWYGFKPLAKSIDRRLNHR
jgi:hypothetical protein